MTISDLRNAAKDSGSGTSGAVAPEVSTAVVPDKTKAKRGELR